MRDIEFCFNGHYLGRDLSECKACKDSQKHTSKWDERFLGLAREIASWSKDPSTQCGTVIIRPDKTIASMGFNGFPRGMDDDPELYEDRSTKYIRTIHSEMNALLHAREQLLGYTLYEWPFLTCDGCAKHIIQAGIRRVVSPKCPSDKELRWKDSFEIARNLYKEAGVEVCEINFE